MANGYFDWDDCRRLIAEQNYTAWHVVADEFADRQGNPGYELAGAMFSLLTGMVELQTLVRMSAPGIDAKRAELAELQKLFPTPKTLAFGRAMYTQPFGPYYLGVTVEQDFLVNNIDNVLSNEPIRYMTVTNCYPSEDFARILRNYRVAQQFRSTFRFRYPPREVMSVARAVKEAHLYEQTSLTLDGVVDRNSMIAAHFMMAPNVSAGVKLMIGRPPVESCSRPNHR